MLKRRIQYYDKTLSIYLGGNINEKELDKIKDNIYTLIRKYGIMRINLEIASNCNINYDCFNEFNCYHHNINELDNLYY